MDKVEEIIPSDGEDEKEHLYWGNVLEDVVAREFAKRTDYKVQRSNFMWQHVMHEFMVANVDRLIHSAVLWMILGWLLTVWYMYFS